MGPHGPSVQTVADASMNNKISGETQKPAQGQLRLGWQWWPRARMRGVLNV